jgi:MscS family membrane protein
VIYFAGAVGVTAEESAVEGVAVASAVTDEKLAMETTQTFPQWLDSVLPETLTRDDVLLRNWQWLALFILVVFGLILERFSFYLAGRFLDRWLSAQNLQVSDKNRLSVKRPAALALMAGFWAAGVKQLALLGFIEEILFIASKLLLVLAVVWTIYRLTDIVAVWTKNLTAKTGSKLDGLLVPLLRKTLKIFVAVLGALYVGEQFIGLDPTRIFAGLGLGGLAFALAGKESISNLFGFLTILFDRPFQIGDRIRIPGADGIVVEVGFRSTRVRTLEDSLLTIPNSVLVNEKIDNLGARTQRRINIKLSVTYATPPEKIEAFCEGVRELIRRIPCARQDVLHVYFNEYAGSSLDVLVYCFLKTTKWEEELAERHRLFLNIKRLARVLGVEFAFPTQTIYVAAEESGAGDAAAFSTPDAKDAPQTDWAAAQKWGKDAAFKLLAGGAAAENGGPVASADKNVSPQGFDKSVS